jgi:hypothetical protein
MDTFQEHNPKQASHTKSTIEEVKEWDEDDLLKWIHQERPGLLKDDNLKKFKAAFINKNIFVDHAGDVGFFENKCKLPIGISESLAKLAREAAGGETAGMAQKGKEQDTSTGKSTPRHASHADVHCPWWLRHTATPDICTLHFHFYRS